MQRSMMGWTIAAAAIVAPGTPGAHAQVVPVSEYWRISEGASQTDSPADLAMSPTGGFSFVAGTRSLGSGLSQFFVLRYSPQRDPMTLLPLTRHPLTWPSVSTGPFEAKAVTVGSSGNIVYVVGQGPAPGGLGTSIDLIVLKLNAADLSFSNTWADLGDGLGVRRYNGPGNGFDGARAVVPDGDGVIVVGTSYGGAVTGNDYVVLKYTSAGALDPTWPSVDTTWPASGFGDGVRRYNGPGNGTDEPVGVDTESGGGVNQDEIASTFVAGTSWGGHVTRNDFATLCIVKADGSLRWLARQDGSGGGDDVAAGMALVKGGVFASRVYITGTGTHPNVVSAEESAPKEPYLDPSRDYRTVCYLEDSNALVWEAYYDGPVGLYDSAAAIAVVGSTAGFESDQVFVVGSSSGQSTGTASALDIKALRYQYDAPSGSVYSFWATDAHGRFDLSGREDRGLDIDASGGINSVFLTGLGTDASGFSDIVTRGLFRADGTLRWHAQYAGASGLADLGRKVAIDPKLGTIPPEGSVAVLVTGDTWEGVTGVNYRTIRYTECDPCP